MKEKIFKFSFAVALCQAAGIVGSFFTMPAIGGWYSRLNKPELTPLNWIFASVWTLLFLLMGIAFYLVLAAERSQRKNIAIIFFIIQLGLNVLWSFLFFGLKSPFYGFLGIVVLWFAIALTIFSFQKISRLAAFLLLPYIIWVSFAGYLNFSIMSLNDPAIEKHILEKADPSGLPENADELRIPIKFNLDLKTIKVKVFFNNSEMDPEFSCNKVFSVERQVPETKAVAMAVLEQLLSGPSWQDKNEGFFTSINSGVKIQSLSIENGLAKVDFDTQLEFQVGGSCRVSAIRSQITETLKQFPSVQEVIISVDGRTEDILQP